MWIISFRKDNQAFAAVYAYTRGARAPLYEAILQRVLQLAPDLKNVELIVSDFERAPRKACKALFPRAKLQGCLFHLVQAISAYWADILKLVKLQAPREAKFLSRSLGLLPPELLTVGIDVLEEVTQSHTTNFPELLRFIAYLRRQWLWDTEWTSVYGSAIIGQIMILKHITAIIRLESVALVSPFLYPFIRNLQEVIENESIKLQRLNNNLPISKIKKEKELYNRDMCIMKVQEKLLAQVKTGSVVLSNITKKAVYDFLRECLPPKIQAKIDEEHGKCFPRKRSELQNSDFLELADENEEYGVKKKRKARRQHSAISSSEQKRQEKKILSMPQDANGTVESEINHDWDVFEYLLLEGHG
ncbi:uncharacterized protein [Fopius arisanus]|uniref:MULE transposase domain-containing protein n=1 Tax=Fopius arisanus TaxID=64838 RepID=A0A9R1TPJ4_9HYME|nr:PREDICTED: uncharacterized protein LOC105272738 [Fopius arisanus]